jgi:RNA polymerase sigma factor (sigma-70 family)
MKLSKNPQNQPPLHPELQRALLEKYEAIRPRKNKKTPALEAALDAWAAVWREAHRYDPDSGVSPTAWVKMRYRGRLKDAWRSSGLAGREAHAIRRAAVRAEAKVGPEPEVVVAAVAAMLALTPEAVRRVLERPVTRLVSANDEDGPELPPDGGASVEAQVAAAEEAALVRAAVAELPPRQREVVALWMAGLSFAEVAVHLGLTHGAVSQRWTKAQGALAKKLAKKGVAR